MKLYDDGGGITKKSLEFWNQNKAKIGRVRTVEASFEPLKSVPYRLEEEIDEITTIEYNHDYNLIITGENGQILLSGCNSGYGGEGPNGTRKILEELGISHQDAVGFMGQKHFKISLIPEIGKGEN